MKKTGESGCQVSGLFVNIKKNFKKPVRFRYVYLFYK